MLNRVTYESCPLCESKYSERLRTASYYGHPLFIPDEMDSIALWMKCSHCAHVYTSGYWDDEAMKRIFATVNQSEHQNTASSNVDTPRLIAGTIIQRTIRLTRYEREPEMIHWLDVGTGSGFVVMTADEWGMKATGIDTRAPVITALKDRGYDARCLDFMAMETRETFEVISMLDVLEHIPFPALALKKAHAMMPSYGALVLSMPNLDSSVWKILDERKKNPYWGEIEHFHNFSRARLYKLLVQHGFTPQSFAISPRYTGCMEVVATKGC